MTTSRTWKGRYLVPEMPLGDALREAKALAKLDHPDAPDFSLMSPEYSRAVRVPGLIVTVVGLHGSAWKPAPESSEECGHVGCQSRAWEGGHPRPPTLGSVGRRRKEKS